MNEHGSVVIGVALIGVLLTLLVGVGAAATIVASHSIAATAADAAALAAAPVTFRPFGASGSPAAEASHVAAANGARLVGCRCPPDPTWSIRTVSVTVRRAVRTPWGQIVDVRATSRATFDPTALLNSRARTSG